MNCSIYIDTPIDIAMARRILRDYNEKTIIRIFEDLEHYLKRGRNVYLFKYKEIKNEADLIIDGTLSVKEIVEKIYEKIIRIKK